MVKLLSFDIFEFINHDKVTFLSARTSPILSHFLRQVKHMRFPSISRLERDPKNIFYYQRDVDNCMDQVLDFLFDRHEYTHTHTHTHTRNLPVCNSGQHIYITGLCNFFFVLQDLIGRINSYCQIIAFQRILLLIGF